MSNIKLIIIGSIAGVIVLGLLVFMVIGNLGGKTPKQATLQFWGVFDDASFYDQAISNFEKANPGVRIVYRNFNDPVEYENQLINSFASGTGPDIWLMHNTWLPKHGDKITPLPQTIKGEKQPLFTTKQFQDQFVDVAYKDLTYGGQIYALPIYVDTLALYYNKDIFNTNGIASPPTTWDEFNNDVAKMTIMDDRGNIVKSGAAIGTAKNINRSTDLLMMLMLQGGAKMTDGDNRSATFTSQVNGENVGQNALQYYVDFANQSKRLYTWNSQQHFSIDAFGEGNVAMMFNYSHHIQTLRAKSARFNFAIAPVPQVSGSPVSVAFADYWAPTVSRQSKNPITAWKFIVSLSSVQEAVTYVNSSNRPSARRDLLSKQKDDTDLSPFATQGLFARSWYQVDNSAIETIFANMIEDVNYGRSSARDALEAAESKVNVLMSRSRAN